MYCHYPLNELRHLNHERAMYVAEHWNMIGTLWFSGKACALYW